MLKNKTINMGVVKKIATALGELNDDVAYVGGATVSISQILQSLTQEAFTDL
jgi:hypothetical protein